jgi:putative regulator of septum formation
MRPGPPTQPQSWPQQGMQSPADRVVDPDGPATDAAATPTDGWTPPPWTSGPDALAGWTPPPWTAGPDAPAGSPLYAADTQPFWRRSLEPILVVIGCAVLIGIGIFFAATDDDHSSPEPVSSYSTDPTTTVDDLAVGDCFDDGDAEGVVRLPCTVAHDGEIIGIVTLPEGPYPGDNGVDKAADRACTHDFTKYVGKSVDDSELDLYYWLPNEDRWNDDDRVVVCDATYNGYAYAKLTGTIKNSHR